MTAKELHRLETLASLGFPVDPNNGLEPALDELFTVLRTCPPTKFLPEHRQRLSHALADAA